MINCPVNDRFHKIEEEIETLKRMFVRRARRITIVTQKRSDDIIAYVKDDKCCWGCGKTTQEAIGDLILTHRDVFGIKVEYGNK